jgi:predicted amidohydrolase
MNERTLSVIALSNRDFPSFEAKLREAVEWIRIAAGRKSDLAVLPETLNLYQGDGPENPNAMTLAEAALDDWEVQTSLLRQAAVDHRIAVTIPVLTRQDGALRNSMFLVSKTGETLGCYTKVHPTTEELDEGVVPGEEPCVMNWEGIKVAGAICFDTHFHQLFEMQARAGAELFLVPSLWPGGDWLNYFASRFSVPVALAYPAWSRIIDINGREVAEGGYRNETLRFDSGLPVYTATLNFDRMRVFATLTQKTLMDIETKYAGRILTSFDQNNCVYTFESRSPGITVAEMAKEFGLTSHRDFFWDYENRRHEALSPKHKRSQP